MRVLDHNTVGQNMGKKKKLRLKRQIDPSEAVTDTSDEGHNAIIESFPDVQCVHLQKSVSVTTIRKFLKQSTEAAAHTFGQCQACMKSESICDHEKPSGDAASDNNDDTIVWLCLQCAHQGCGRNSQQQHALKHFNTPHSISHALVLNTTSWQIWCYDCDDEVNINSSKKLSECIDLIRRQVGLSPYHEPPVQQHQHQPSSAKHGEDQVKEETTTTIGEQPRQKKSKAAGGSSLQKIRGLSNLGNTCFFNAVMQNLSQTVFLEGILSECTKKGMNITLPGGRPTMVDSPMLIGEDVDEDNKADPCLKSLTVILSESGPLTQTMYSFLRDHHSLEKLSSTLSPNALFSQICRKAPRFKGFQQQDSHELLRHLLDGIRAEEIKRLKLAILREFNLNEASNRKKVDDDTKAKLKVYGHQAQYSFIDHIFGGHLLSSVLCEECSNVSQVFEPFLDLSLPVTDEKPSRPSGARNNYGGTIKPSSKDEDSINSADNPYHALDKLYIGKSTESISKYQSKKQRKQAKRKKKRDQRFNDTTSQNDDVNECDDETKAGDKSPTSGKSGSDDEKNSQAAAESDADIEDNEDHDSEQNHGGHDEAAEIRGVLDSLKLKENNPTVHAKTLDGDITHKQGGGDDSQQNNGSDISNQIRKLSTCSGNDVAMRSDDKCSDERAASRRKETTLKRDEPGDGASSEYDNVEKKSTPSVSPTSITRETTKTAGKESMSTLASRSQLVPGSCRTNSGGGCTIQSCLNQFTTAELLTGANKFGCEHCTKYKNPGSTVYTNASKQFLIFSPPVILTVHLKRFQQVGYSLRKVNRHVDFPVILDIAPFCSASCQGRISAEQKNILYSLYGVVEHTGRLSGGHYTAYVKVRSENSRTMYFMRKRLECMNSVAKWNFQNGGSCSLDGLQGDESDAMAVEPTAGKWFHISDSHVREVSESSVLNCQAYILFYERML